VSAFPAVLAAVSFLAAAVAAVAGFGFGSLLTPVLATHVGTKLAVAAATVPHLVCTAVRLWTLRDKIDRSVLRTFGLTSVIGGMAGAILHAFTTSRVLALLLAVILIITGLMGVFGLTLRFNGHGASLAGGFSGFLGGMVGSQGPVRAGAMLGFELPKESFVATGMAIAVFVDSVRMPVYIVSNGPAVAAIWPLIAIATAAGLVGTLTGRALLHAIPERLFKRGVAAALVVLGATLLFRA
jgi:uncharacterized membrane protein YfcA